MTGAHRSTLRAARPYGGCPVSLGIRNGGRRMSDATPAQPYVRRRQPKGRRGEDDHGRLRCDGTQRLGRRVLAVDLDPQACLTFSLGLDPEALELSIHDVLLGRVSAAHGRSWPTADGAGPAAGDDRPGRLRGDAAHPHRPRVRPATRARGDPRRLRRDPARLRAVARRADAQRADRGRRGAHPAAVRDAVASRCRPAARHRARRPAADQPATWL